MSLETKRIKELFGYARTLTKEQGVGVMAARAAGFFKRRFFGKKARYLPAKQTLETQRADAAQNAKNWPTISILTPLYNTPPQFLQQFLDSVQGQTAPNWQLVLVDASDADHADVAHTVQARAAYDPHIIYRKIENKGIAANTNEAAKLATGAYLALADHDDMLAPHAVYCMSKRLAETGADFATGLWSKKSCSTPWAVSGPSTTAHRTTIYSCASSTKCSAVTRLQSLYMSRRCCTIGVCMRRPPAAAPGLNPM